MPHDPLHRFPAFAAELRNRIARDDHGRDFSAADGFSELREQALDLAAMAFRIVARLDSLAPVALEVDPPAGLLVSLRSPKRKRTPKRRPRARKQATSWLDDFLRLTEGSRR